MTLAEKKRRRRTGCLTCRTRRVKCDEGKPTCERCNAANIECVGYEEKRHVETKRPPRSSTTKPLPDDQVDSSVTTTSPYSETLSSPHLRSDGLPLVALPSNPLPIQRPHTRARDILAYHQFLFRTLPLLFRPDELHFWRDRICQEAWENEFLYDTIMAVGGAHRAILMMSSMNEIDREGGVDNKVTAVQAYTKTLQGLSAHLDDAGRSPELFVGTLLLLTWFECLPGNLPAALRHAYIASRYFLFMQGDESQQGQPHMLTIESNIRNLAQMFRVILPFPNLRLPVPHSRSPSPALSVLTPSSGSTATNMIPPSFMLQQLLDFLSNNPDLEELVWNPLTPHQRLVSPDKIYAFQAEIRDWRNSHAHILPEFEAEHTISTLSDFSWNVIDELAIPPRLSLPISPQMSMISALYNFYMARSMWALSLVELDSDRYEIYAYLHFYEVMQLVASLTEGLGSSKGQMDNYIPRETLGIGFIPILYFTGQCSPKPSWLRWTMEKLNQIGQEGLFRGRDFAKSLNGLFTFEMCNSIESPLLLDRFPSPSARVIVALIPAEDGRRFTAYYASPTHKNRGTGEDAFAYYPLGHAQWSSVRGDELSKPDVEFYKSDLALTTQFNAEWLLTQQEPQDWITWSSLMDFNIDLLLRDHVSGCHLWPGGDFRAIFRFASGS